MKKNFFTKWKIITFYYKMEKHKIFKKINIFYHTLSWRESAVNYADEEFYVDIVFYVESTRAWPGPFPHYRTKCF